ncbi:prepilin-type N-terminal cleavage/methylation domain-containing protein [Roseateles sp. P5_E4]
MQPNTSTRTLSATSKAQRGIGLVELMVGITVGLIVTAGAAMVATRQINEHRRLMLEVQMQQDLRIAADLLQQDLRRAGYRGLPANSVWEPEHDAGAIPAKEASSSPYAAASASAGGEQLLYQYARTASGVLNTKNVLTSNEQFGVRWKKSNKSLEIQLGQDNWQPITDPDAVQIENFVANVVTQQVSLAELCDPTSACVAAGTCPTQGVRRVDFTIKAVSKSDPTVKRTLQVSEKLRSDEISGACQ